MEQWKPSKNWPGYSISNEGRVRSEITTTTRSNGRPHTRQQKIISINIDSQGYCQFYPYKDKKRSNVLVHREVFETFVRPLEPGEHVDHIDSDKTNNRLENLQAVSGHTEHWQHTWGRIFKKHYDEGYAQGYQDALNEL